MKKAIVFAATYAAMHAAHQVADHWVQTDDQANHKGDYGTRGTRACAGHVATYTATTAVAVASLRALGAPISTQGLLAGQAISAVSHFVMDRRPWGRAIMRHLGKGDFAKLGAPRPRMVATSPDSDERTPLDAPHLGTGAYALDQSWHIGWIAVSAFVTAALS